MGVKMKTGHIIWNEIRIAMSKNGYQKKLKL